MKKNYLICIWGIFSLISIKSFSQKEIYTKLNVKELFSLGVDLNGGIIGNASASDPIVLTVRDTKYNTIMYQLTLKQNSTQFTGDGQTYQKGELGSGATYYPNTWNSSNIKESAFAMDKKYAKDAGQVLYLFLQNSIDVTVSIIQSGNSHYETVKIPGIGELGANPLFDIGHFCHDISEVDDCPCAAWTMVKSPDISKGSDFVIAAHRGIWGDDLGNGNPENSVASIEATPPITPVLESDVMITKDDNLIVSHDYNLDRLSDYTGSDRDYLFNMNYSEITPLNLRKRNESVSKYKYLSYSQMIDLLLENKLVLTIDIKDIRARYGKDGQCIDNCEYDPSTHSDAPEKILNSWKKIFKICYQIAEEKNALAYIAFKTPHDYDVMKTVFSEEELSKILFMPVIQPKRDEEALERALNFIDSWNQKAGKRVVAYETNFKQLSDPYLQSFTRNGKRYDNLLHYVYETTGLRPGCYPEEPMGPRGIVNRWADWLIKDSSKDMRGDHFEMVEIPYGKIMVLTTDRPEIWKQITDMYNK